MKVSVVMPVHNEERYLPYSLASLLQSPIDELVVVLDRCTDKSMIIAERFAKIAPYNVKLIRKNSRKWEYPIGESFEVGFSKAEGEFVYTMAADIVTDPKIYNIRYFDGCDIVSFYYHNYDLDAHFRLHEGYLNFLKKVVPTLRSFSEFGKRTGHFGVRRSVWQQIHFKDVPSPDTQFFSDLWKAGFKHKYVSNVKNLHLRVGLRRSRQFLQGLHRAKNNVHPVKVFFHTLFYFKPFVIVGFYYGKKYGDIPPKYRPYI